MKNSVIFFTTAVSSCHFTCGHSYPHTKDNAQLPKKKKKKKERIIKYLHAYALVCPKNSDHDNVFLGFAKHFELNRFFFY